MLQFLIVLLVFPVVAQAATVTVEYDEPTTQIDGAPLTDLKETTIYYRVDQLFAPGIEQKLIVPATQPSGGGHIVKVLTVPDPTLCGPALVSVTATATSQAGKTSGRAAAVGKAVAAPASLACTKPKDIISPTLK